VRHGETDWTAAGRLSGWRDVELNSVGRDQARGVRGRLAEREYAGVWSSDLRRASETAHLAYGPPVLDPRLREIDFGALEGMRWAELSADRQRGLLDFDGFAAPGGESVDDLRDRVLDFVSSLARGHHLLFTHGGVIRLLLREAASDERVGPGMVVPIDLFSRAARPGSRACAPWRNEFPGDA